MKHLNVLPLILLLIYVIYSSSGNLDSFKEYHHTKSHHYSSTLSPFRRLYGLSQNACVYQCSIRKKCKSLNYKRKYQACELNDATGSIVVNNQEPSVYMERSDIQDNSCGCDDNEVCMDTKAMQCSIEECEPLTQIDNGKISGNMNKIGSKLKVTCNDGYEEKDGRMYTTCLTNGNWEFVPECVKCQIPNTGQQYIHPDTKLEPFVFKIRINVNTLPQAEAVKACACDGGNLVKIDTQPKQAFILSVLTNSEYSRTDFWIDGSNVKASNFSASNAWTFFDGTSVPMNQNIYWRIGAPGHPNKEHCVRMRATDDHLWNDQLCSNTYGYI